MATVNDFSLQQYGVGLPFPRQSQVSRLALAVNPAFFQEIQEDNLELRRLLACLRRIFARPHSSELMWRQWLPELLAQLRDQLALHFSLEEAFGYFDEPVSVAPQLCDMAHALRDEHAVLYLNICDIAEQAEQFTYAEQPTSRRAQLASAFKQFDADLREHDNREAQLVLEAFDQDIGVGD